MDGCISLEIDGFVRFASESAVWETRWRVYRGQNDFFAYFFTGVAVVAGVAKSQESQFKVMYLAGR